MYYYRQFGISTFRRCTIKRVLKKKKIRKRKTRLKRLRLYFIYRATIYEMEKKLFTRISEGPKPLEKKYFAIA